MKPFGQGFISMSAPTKEIEKMFLSNEITHDGNPVMEWMMTNVMLRFDPAGNIKIDKAKSTEKVDGPVAMVMAFDVSPSKRTGSLVAAQIVDGKIGVGLMETFSSEIANKTIALADANKKILQTGREYYATLESTKLAINGYADASVYQASAIAKAKDANIEARNEALALRSGIIGLRTEVNNLYVSASGNPFFNFIKGADDTTKATDKATRSVEKLGKQARVLKVSTTQIIQTENEIKTPATPNNLSKDLPMFAQQYNAEQIFKNEAALKAYNTQLQLANGITDTITPAFEAMFQAMANGENIGLVANVCIPYREDV